MAHSPMGCQGSFSEDRNWAVAFDATQGEPQPDAAFLVFRFGGALWGLPSCWEKTKMLCLPVNSLFKATKVVAIEIAKDARVFPLPLWRVVEVDFDDESVLE